MAEIDSELQSLRDFYADLEVDIVDEVWRQSGQDYKTAMEELAAVVKSPSEAARIRKTASIGVRSCFEVISEPWQVQISSLSQMDGSDFPQTRPPISTSGSQLITLCVIAPHSLFLLNPRTVSENYGQSSGPPTQSTRSFQARGACFEFCMGWFTQELV